MTLFTFHTNYDKLINETKLQSLRYNADYWINRLAKNNKLDIWWRNPRNQQPDCKKLGIARGTATPLYGHEFTETTARDDGYDSMSELFEVLTELHNMTREDILKHRWAKVQWFWVERYWLTTAHTTTTVQATFQELE
ncbi:MAG: hypothetical protein DRH04_08470 [Deltaproteobacteria bacterium]|nr:MAG: hypothetical protein DRH04_08470 [Deltaproteobacteria bacterium]